MTVDVFETEQLALQNHMIARYGREFQRFSNIELVRVFNEMIDVMNVDLLLELGAHRAATSKRFVAAKAGRKAVAVEANPFNFQKFGPKAQNAGVLYMHYALTNETAPLNLVLSDSDQDRKRGHTKTSNSILRNLDFGRTMNVEVPGITLDALEKEKAFVEYTGMLGEKQCALWIDVEGALSQLLEGAAHSLPKCLFAIAELERVERFEGQKTAEHVIAQFAELGFTPFLRDSEYMPEQQNTIFVNEKATAAFDLSEIKYSFIRNIKAFQREA